MSADFQGTIRQLVDGNAQISSAMFADLDGAEIAAYPASARNDLKHCAAYGGIALRRLTVAERLAGRDAVKELILEGAHGAFMAVAIGTQYQFIATLSGPFAASQGGPSIRRTADELARAAHL